MSNTMFEILEERSHRQSLANETRVITTLMGCTLAAFIVSFAMFTIVSWQFANEMSPYDSCVIAAKLVGLLSCIVTMVFAFGVYSCWSTLMKHTSNFQNFEEIHECHVRCFNDSQINELLKFYDIKETCDDGTLWIIERECMN